MSVIINFSITSPDIGNPWSGTIEVTNDAEKVLDTTTAIITSNAEDVTFTAAQSAAYSEYVTLRSVSIVGQFPTTGFSMDIWSSTFVEDVLSNQITWAGLDGQSYSLTSDKHSLIYSYDEPFAPYWSKGGTLSFSIA